MKYTSASARNENRSMDAAERNVPTTPSDLQHRSDRRRLGYRRAEVV